MNEEWSEKGPLSLIIEPQDLGEGICRWVEEKEVML